MYIYIYIYKLYISQLTEVIKLLPYLDHDTSIFSTPTGRLHRPTLGPTVLGSPPPGFHHGAGAPTGRCFGQRSAQGLRGQQQQPATAHESAGLSSWVSQNSDFWPGMSWWFWVSRIWPSGSESSRVCGSFNSQFIQFVVFFLRIHQMFRRNTYVEHEFVFASFKLRFIKCISMSTGYPTNRHAMNCQAQKKVFSF